MSLLTGYLLPAILISACALIALNVAQSAPARVRLGLASIGLFAWLVPWSLIRIPLVELPVAGIQHTIVTAAEQLVPVTFAPHWSWLVIFLPGLAWFTFELVACRVTIDRWRRESRCGEALRRYLPVEIADRPAEIRIVADSSVAAATGWFRPTIWIGQGVIDKGEQQLALVHEASHVHRGDPLRLVLIGLIARSFWFNPIVTALQRHAILAIESGCDEACARWLGRKQYRKALAHLVLTGQAPSGPALAAALRSSKLDLLRLDLLASSPRMDRRAWAAVIVVLAAVVYGAALGAAGPAPADVSAVEPTPSAAFGDARFRPSIGTAFSVPSHYGYDVPPQWSRR